MRELSSDEQMLAFRFAHLPLPEDAVECDPWCWHGGDDWRRYFMTQEWDVSGMWVSVAGEQNHHGDITRWMHVGGDDQCSTSDRVELIAALVDAGHLLDTLNAADSSLSPARPATKT